MAGYADYQSEYLKKKAELDAKIRKENAGRRQNSDGQGSQGTPSWALLRENLRLDEADTTRIRIIPQKTGEQWITFFSKWIPVKQRDGSYKKRQVISNSWNGERDVPCVLYHYALEEQKDDYLAVDQVAASVLVLEEFLLVPRVSGAGRKYNALVRSKGIDRFGKSLNPPEYAGLQTQFGCRKFLPLFKLQHNRLMEQLETAGEKCANCKTGEISVYAYECPECKNIFANHNEQDIDQEFEHALRTQELKCRKCGATVKASQLYECVRKEGFGAKAHYVTGCDNPIRLSPTDPMDITLKLVPSGKGTAIQVVDISPPEDLTGIVDASLLEPMHLESFLCRMSLKDQAQNMGKANPFPEADEKLLDAFFEAPPTAADAHSIPWEEK